MQGLVQGDTSVFRMEGKVGKQASLSLRMRQNVAFILASTKLETWSRDLMSFNLSFLALN